MEIEFCGKIMGLCQFPIQILPSHSPTMGSLFNGGFSRDIGTFYEIRDFPEDFQDLEDGPSLPDTFYVSF